jgi:hypothetical protein
MIKQRGHDRVYAKERRFHLSYLLNKMGGVSHKTQLNNILPNHCMWLGKIYFRECVKVCAPTSAKGDICLKKKVQFAAEGRLGPASSIGSGCQSTVFWR